MRRQARRLWLGDWQRDQEADHDDTVVITPEADEEADFQPAERQRNVRREVAALLAIGALIALAFAVSSGGSDKPVASQQSSAQTQPPQVLQIPPNQTPQAPQGAPPQGFGGADLTGAGATKAAQAALAQFPGAVERVTAGPAGGGYVVHVIQSDGNEVHVLVDGQFKVQGSDGGSPPPTGGPGSSSQ